MKLGTQLVAPNGDEVFYLGSETDQSPVRMGMSGGIPITVPKPVSILVKEYGSDWIVATLFTTPGATHFVATALGVRLITEGELGQYRETPDDPGPFVTPYEGGCLIREHAHRMIAHLRERNPSWARQSLPK